LEIDGNKKFPPEITVYNCKICNYTCNKKSSYDKHIVTKKHINNTNIDNIMVVNLCVNCNKTFANSSGLWKHKKKCVNNKNIEENNEECKFEINDNKITFTPDLFFELFKQSKELQNVIIEQNRELQNTFIAQSNKMFELSQKHSIVNNTNSNNTVNNQFNLQFFLNETCKDAMNITDFVNSLQITTSDFENTGRLGYVEGISRIIINGLKDIDVEKRPIHCTDLKRETVYIKHDNTWEKEEPDKKKLKWAVNSIARLNLQQLDKWQEENPEYKVGESTKNYEYLKYCSAALGGQYKEEDDKFAEKIMKNVLKNVVVDKRV
jgi:hypothetical protein